MLNSGTIIFNHPNGEGKLRQEGHEEAVKELTKEQEETEKQLNDLVQKSTQPLIKVSSHPLFALSSVELSAELDKINVYFKQALSSGQIKSIPIKDIGTIIAEIGPIFATIKIVENRPAPENEMEVKYLKKAEAIRFRRIVQGLIISTKMEIDISKLDISELTEKMEILGQAQEVE